MTRKLIGEYAKWGLEVILKKTGYMCDGGQQQYVVLESGTTIKHCREYKYLSLKIIQDETLDMTKGEKNILGQKTASVPNGVLWDNNVDKENLTRFY